MVRVLHSLTSDHLLASNTNITGQIFHLFLFFLPEDNCVAAGCLSDL